MIHSNIFINVFLSNIKKIIFISIFTFIGLFIFDYFFNKRSYDYEINGYLSLNKESLSQNEILESINFEIFKGSLNMESALKKYEIGFKNLMCRKSTAITNAFEKFLFEIISCDFGETTSYFEFDNNQSEIQSRVGDILKVYLSFEDLSFNTLLKISSLEDYNLFSNTFVNKIQFQFENERGKNNVFVKYNTFLKSDELLSKDQLNLGIKNIFDLINNDYNLSIKDGFKKIEYDLKNIIETLINSLIILRESLEDTHYIHYTTLSDNLKYQSDEEFNGKNKTQILDEINFQKNNFKNNIIIGNINSHINELKEYAVSGKIDNIKDSYLKTNKVSNLNFRYNMDIIKVYKNSLLASIWFLINLLFYSSLLILYQNKKS